MNKIIDTYLSELAEVVAAVSKTSVLGAFELIEAAYLRGSAVYIIGNGGSASTASHMACDFGKGASRDSRRRLRVISLTDNVAHISAISNDMSYDVVFLEQLRNLLRKDDLVIGISASGNSKNLVNSFEYASTIGANTIALVGFDGGAIGKLATASVHVRVDSYGIAEDLHLIVNHMWTELLKDVVERSSVIT